MYCIVLHIGNVIALKAPSKRALPLLAIVLAKQQVKRISRMVMLTIMLQKEDYHMISGQSAHLFQALFVCLLYDYCGDW